MEDKKLVETELKEAHYDPADYWHEDPYWYRKPKGVKSPDADYGLMRRAEKKHGEVGDYSKMSASAAANSATKDYTNDAAAKQFWSDVKKGTVNIKAFHDAYDDALKAADCPADIWDENGQLKGKFVWGKIKSLDNSLASVRALRKLWGSTFMKNETLKEMFIPHECEPEGYIDEKTCKELLDNIYKNLDNYEDAPFSKFISLKAGSQKYISYQYGNEVKITFVFPAKDTIEYDEDEYGFESYWRVDYIFSLKYNLKNKDNAQLIADITNKLENGDFVTKYYLYNIAEYNGLILKGTYKGETEEEYENFDEALAENNQNSKLVETNLGEAKSGLPGTEYTIADLLKQPWTIRREGNIYGGLEDSNDEIGKLLSKVKADKFPKGRAAAEKLAKGIINNIQREMENRKPNELKAVIDEKIAEGIDNHFNGNPMDKYKAEYNRVKNLNIVGDAKDEQLRRVTKELLPACHRAMLAEAIVRRFFESDLANVKANRRKGATRALDAIDPKDLEFIKDWFRKHVTHIFFSVPKVDDESDYIGDENIPEDDFEKRDESNKAQQARINEITDSFFREYPNAIRDKDYKFRFTSVSPDPRKDRWHLGALTTFDVKVEDTPEVIKTFIANAKKQSLEATKTISDMANDYGVESCPLAQAILKLFNNDFDFYKKDEVKPTSFGDAFDAIMPEVEEESE